MSVLTKAEWADEREEAPETDKVSRRRRRDRCIEYLRRTDSLPAARELAKKEHFGAATSARISALAEVLRPRKREKDMFLSGMLAALAVVSDAEADTIRDEIVATAGFEDLIRVARKTGSMRWSGMSRYLREEKANER